MKKVKKKKKQISFAVDFVALLSKFFLYNVLNIINCPT